MTSVKLLDKDITGSIIGAFFDVYNTLGWGFLEHLYVKALEHELRLRGHTVVRQARVEVWYKGVLLGAQKVDLLVDARVVVEAKASELLPRAARAQLYNYLRATSKNVGLLLHFGPDPDFQRVFCRDAKRDGVPVDRALYDEEEPAREAECKNRLGMHPHDQLGQDQ